MDIRNLFNLAGDNRIKFDGNHTINKFNSTNIKNKDTALALILDFIRYIPSTGFEYPKQEILLGNSELSAIMSSNANKEKICGMAMFGIIMNHYRKYSLDKTLEKLGDEDIMKYWKGENGVDKISGDNPESYLKGANRNYYLYVYNDIQRLKNEAKDDIVAYYKSILSGRDLEILNGVIDFKIEGNGHAMKKMTLVSSYLYYLLGVSLNNENIKNDAKQKISKYLPELILE